MELPAREQNTQHLRSLLIPANDVSTSKVRFAQSFRGKRLTTFGLDEDDVSAAEGKPCHVGGRIVFDQKTPAPSRLPPTHLWGSVRLENPQFGKSVGAPLDFLCATRPTSLDSSRGRLASRDPVYGATRAGRPCDLPADQVDRPTAKAPYRVQAHSSAHRARQPIEGGCDRRAAVRG